MPKESGEASEVGVVLPQVIGGFPARVTRRRSPPVIVPAASSLRSSADGQACSAKIAAFAVVFAEGTARCWWSTPGPPGYWWLRRPRVPRPTLGVMPLGVMPVVGQLPSPLQGHGQCGQPEHRPADAGSDAGGPHRLLLWPDTSPGDATAASSPTGHRWSTM